MADDFLHVRAPENITAIQKAVADREARIIDLNGAFDLAKEYVFAIADEDRLITRILSKTGYNARVASRPNGQITVAIPKKSFQLQKTM